MGGAVGLTRPTMSPTRVVELIVVCKCHCHPSTGNSRQLSRHAYPLALSVPVTLCTNSQQATMSIRESLSSLVFVSQHLLEDPKGFACHTVYVLAKRDGVQLLSWECWNMKAHFNTPNSYVEPHPCLQIRMRYDRQTLSDLPTGADKRRQRREGFP